MKRKLFAGLLIFAVLMMLCASCSGKPQPLNACGEKIISLMAEMIESEEYKSLYSLSDAYSEKVYKLCEGNYTKSKAVYELSIPKKELFGGAVNEDDFSKDLYKYICSSAHTFFASIVNTSGGMEGVAVSTAFSAQKSFVNKNLDTNKIYLYVFESGCPIVITFIADGDGSVRATGHFILNDAFVTDDENSIKESCEALGLQDVAVKKQ